MSTKESKRRGFTVTEVLVVLVAAIVLAAILFPVFERSRADARTLTCASNLRQINQALSLYISDHDGFYPPIATVVNTSSGVRADSYWWMNIGLQPPPMCPEVDFDLLTRDPILRTRMGSYASNANLGYNSTSGAKLSASGRVESVLRYPPLTVVAFDSRPKFDGMRQPDTARTVSELERVWYSYGWEDRVLQLPLGATRHQGGANYLFADGHVKWYLPEQLSTKRINDGVHPGFGL